MFSLRLLVSLLCFRMRAAAFPLSGDGWRAAGRRWEEGSSCCNSERVDGGGERGSDDGRGRMKKGYGSDMTRGGSSMGHRAGGSRGRRREPWGRGSRERGCDQSRLRVTVTRTRHQTGITPPDAAPDEGVHSLNQSGQRCQLRLHSLRRR